MKLLRLLLPVLLAGCAVAPPVARVAPPAPTQVATGPAVVSAAHPLAAEAGRAILAKGGNALDAALATMLALTVVEPQSSGIGGGGFLVYHRAAKIDCARNARPCALIETYDGREQAPAGVTPELFLDVNGRPLPFDVAVAGGKSVGVPGNLALMAKAHAAHGALPWAALFDPAIALARDGFAVSPRLHQALVDKQAFLASSAEARALYYQPDGSPKPVDTLVRNPALAKLFAEIAARGASHYYQGPPAERLVAAVANSPRNPSSMTVADVRAYAAKTRPPVCGRYRVYTICGMGPPSSGGVAVYAILKQLERFNLGALKRDDPKTWHLIAESMRLAYADRAKWIGDPDHVTVPTSGLMDERYLAERSALISPDRAMAHVEPGRPAGTVARADVPDTEVAGTTHFVVADTQGNVASMTSTVEAPFGSGLVVDGYVLNNELTDFNFVPSVNGVPAANRVEPGKRPRSSMSPTIVYDASDQPILAIGAAGGPTIIAQVAKALIGVLDWKLSVQEAIALPQIMGQGDRVRVEAGTPLAAMADPLRALGHAVDIAAFPAKANGVERVGKVWRGGADPRSEGRALGL